MMQYQFTLFVLLAAALVGAANLPSSAPKLVPRQETTLSLNGSPYLTISSGLGYEQPSLSATDATSVKDGTTYAVHISSDGGYSASVVGQNRATTGALSNTGGAAGGAAASSSAGSTGGSAVATTSAHSGAAGRSAIEAGKVALLCATAVSAFIALAA